MELSRKHSLYPLRACHHLHISLQEGQAGKRKYLLQTGMDAKIRLARAEGTSDRMKFIQKQNIPGND